MDKKRNRLKNFGPVMAVDDLGRVLPDENKSCALRENRQVGIFYLLWLGFDGGKEYNNFREMFEKYDIETLKSADSPLFKHKPFPDGGMFFWDEPLFDCYFSFDEWVIRKHIKLLTLADIDFLIVDSTNQFFYEENALKLMKILNEYDIEGYKVPKIIFYTNTDSGTRIKQIYEGVYEKNIYPDLWFRLRGKPAIIGNEKEVGEDLKEFFTIKASQWPNMPKVEGGFPWMDFIRPQRVFSNSDGSETVVNVSIAQNSAKTARFGDTVFYGDTDNCGRSYHKNDHNITEDSYLYGYNFEEQWERAIDVDPEIVTVMSWNEWIAGAWDNTGAGPEMPVAVWDCINAEYSRDCEPMRGGYFDNYYIQLVKNIRKYKGTVSTPIQDKRVAIDIKGSFEQWQKVQVEYKNFKNGNMHRICEGYKGVLVNTSGRNNIVSAKVANDDDNLYFYVKTNDNITAFTGAGTWMQLYLNCNRGKGINGYDYLVNHMPLSEGITGLAKYNDQGMPESAGELEYNLKENEMMIKVPKKLLGLSAKEHFSFEFKWADSNTSYNSVEDFYTEGDVAPTGRFNYLFSC